MPGPSISDLRQSIIDNILTGGRRTIAAGVRTTLNLIVDFLEYVGVSFDPENITTDLIFDGTNASNRTIERVKKVGAITQYVERVKFTDAGLQLISEQYASGTLIARITVSHLGGTTILQQIENIAGGTSSTIAFGIDNNYFSKKLALFTEIMPSDRKDLVIKGYVDDALNSKQDRLAGIVSGCEITVETFSGTPVATNKQIKVSKGLALTNKWYIPTSEYSKLADTVSAEITLCVTGGDFKYYDVVADSAGAITIHEGTPSTSPAHYVIDPLTEVLLGFITVGDAVIEEPAIVVTSLTKKNQGFGVLSGSFTLDCESKDFPIFDIQLGGTTATLNFSNYWNVVEGIIYIRVNSTTTLTLPSFSYSEGATISSKVFGTGYYKVIYSFLYGNCYFDFGVAGSITDLSGIPTSTATASTPTFFDASKNLISATAALLGTFWATFAGKSTPVDADTITIGNSASSFSLVKTTLLELWNNLLKAKADLLYATKSMAANTVRGNNTGSTANGVDLTTDQFTAMMEIAVSVGTTGIITAMTSATYKYIRLTSASATGLGSIIAPSSSYKDLYIWNDTGVTLTLYHDYSSEATAANRILCGANRSWANNTMLHLKYDVVESRWCTVAQDGNTFRALLAGTGDRLVQASATGQESATLTTQDIDFTPAQKTSATTGSWTGVNEITISGLKQGQYYADIAGGFNYECHENDKCNRTPNVNLTPITTNLIYPITEITGTSGTLIVDNAFVLNNASQVVMALPASATQGDLIIVNGKGAGGWKITQAASQQIVGGLTNTTAGVTGYVSAGQYASLTLKCITGGSSTVWEIVCINPAATLTIV